MRTSLALACVLALSALASADVVEMVAVQYQYDVVTGPNNDLTYYKVYLQAETGYLSQGFDGRFDGPMNQIWAGGSLFETPQEDYITALGALTPAEWAMDSHLELNTTDAGFQVVRPPHEDGPGVGSWLANTAALTMSIAWPGTTDNFLLAQIVVVGDPGDNPVVASGSGGWKRESDGAYGDNLMANVELYPMPEPATLGLLVIGAFGVLLRRRR